MRNRVRTVRHFNMEGRFGGFGTGAGEIAFGPFTKIDGLIFAIAFNITGGIGDGTGKIDLAARALGSC